MLQIALSRALTQLLRQLHWRTRVVDVGWQCHAAWACYKHWWPAAYDDSMTLFIRGDVMCTPFCSSERSSCYVYIIKVPRQHINMLLASVLYIAVSKIEWVIATLMCKASPPPPITPLPNPSWDCYYTFNLLHALVVTGRHATPIKPCNWQVFLVNE